MKRLKSIHIKLQYQNEFKPFDRKISKDYNFKFANNKVMRKSSSSIEEEEKDMTDMW